MQAVESIEETGVDLAELPESFTLYLRNKGKTDPRAVHNVLAGIRAGMTLGASLAANGITSDRWYQWQDQFPQLRELQLQSLEVGTHALAQQCLELADHAQEDREALGKAKLQIDTRLKLITKWNRQFYGDELSQVASHSFNVNVDLGDG